MSLTDKELRDMVAELKKPTSVAQIKRGEMAGEMIRLRSRLKRLRWYLGSQASVLGCSLDGYASPYGRAMQRNAVEEIDRIDRVLKPRLATALARGGKRGAK